MSYTYSGGGNRSTSGSQWSQWDWDTRGFWISSRFNSQGAIEYQYEYPQNQNLPAEVASASQSSQTHHEENTTTQGNSEGTFGDDYETSPNADPQYPTTFHNETIPRSQYPNSTSSNNVTNYRPTYSSPAAGGLTRGSTGAHDGLSHGIQNLNLGIAGSSTTNQYGNSEIAPRTIRGASGGADREELDQRYRVIPNGK